ncbi:MAG TPA: hypothetical protein PLD02_13485 [Saprospiraceae bacterium]|nr:hypothetical protein [Saprospiraceae bacterium]
MKIIVDSGSTKAHWALINDHGLISIFETTGINPMTTSKSSILSSLNIVYQHFIKETIETIHFYGAGCKGAAKEGLQNIFHDVFPNTSAILESDLLGAARSCCGGKPGIVAIMGTGSHSCLSDGHKIIHERPGLGYLLGDEGSGNHLGKLLLKSYFYDELTTVLRLELELSHPTVKDNYLATLYSSNRVSKELASFVPFIIDHLQYPEIINIVRTALKEFYSNRLSYYSDKKEWPLYFNGSVAYLMREYLKPFLLEYGFTNVHFNQNPIHSLVQYHLNYD